VKVLLSNQCYPAKLLERFYHSEIPDYIIHEKKPFSGGIWRGDFVTIQAKSAIPSYFLQTLYPGEEITTLNINGHITSVPKESKKIQLDSNLTLLLPSHPFWPFLQKSVHRYAPNLPTKFIAKHLNSALMQKIWMYYALTVDDWLIGFVTACRKLPKGTIMEPMFLPPWELHADTFVKQLYTLLQSSVKDAKRHSYRFCEWDFVLGLPKKKRQL
jgi:hypothetical protein